MTLPHRTILHSNCTSSRGEEHLSALWSEVHKTLSSIPEPPHYRIQRAAAKSSEVGLAGKGSQPKLVTKAQAGKGHPATRTITANRHTQKAFQWPWTMLMKPTPCQTMLHCPLLRKWSSQILSQTSPASNRTLASANLSLQPSRPLWLIWSTLQ